MLHANEDEEVVNLASQSSPAVARTMTAINARCLEHGQWLWNCYQIVPSLLHLYNAFQQVGLSARIAIVDELIKLLSSAGAKGFFEGKPPKKNFYTAFDFMASAKSMVWEDIKMNGVKVNWLI